MKQMGLDEAKQKIVEDILKDLPTSVDVEVKLPSECRVYTLIDPGQPVTVRPMTFDDEKFLVSAKKEQDPINLLLQRCVTNINISELLSMDKLYLIMKLREISYGDDYSTLLICNSCGEENPVTVKLSQLNVNPVPDDFQDPITVTLPELNKKVKIRYPRLKDQAILAQKDNPYDQIWRFIIDIDGYSDKAVIAAVINKLPIRDIKTILNALKLDYGVDTNIKFECKKCGGVSIVDLPINENFFNVS